MNSSKIQKTIEYSKKKISSYKNLNKLEEKEISGGSFKKLVEGCDIIEDTKNFSGVKNLVSVGNSRNYFLNVIENVCKNIKKTKTGKRKNDKKKSLTKIDKNFNKKIDMYCNKKSNHNFIEPQKLLINPSFINNHLQMNEDTSMIVEEKQVYTSKNQMNTPEYNIISTQTSHNLDQNPLNSGNVSPFSINEGSITMFSKVSVPPKLKLFHKVFSEEEIKENFNLKKNMLELEENLLNIRMPDYLIRQKYIDTRMRLILLDWMMEVCCQLSFKRSTYHSAVILLDIYLSKVTNVQINLLQLIGVTCLIIAAKNEEIVIPSMQAFSHSTDYAYTIDEIIANEKVVLNALKWKIHYPSMAYWCNYISLKWDKFVDEFPRKHAYDMNPQFKNLKLPKFRHHTDEEYYFFRNFYQIIDAITLDIEYLKYSEKLLVAGTIYLLLGLYLKCFNISNIVKDFWKDESIYSNYYELNMIFNKFVMIYLDCGLDLVIPHIMHVGFFFNLKFDYTIPVMTRDEDGENSMSYEEYLQIQTHNPNNIVSVEHIISMRNSIFNHNHGTNKFEISNSNSTNI